MSTVLKDLIQLEEIDAQLDGIFVQNEEAPISNPTKQPTPMTDGELISVIDAEMGASYGEENSELSQDRARALDYYFNRPRGDEARGRSQVQSSDVMDVIEWMLPDIIEAFTTNDQAVAFAPNGKEDIKHALEETAYINDVFYNDSNGYLMLHDFFKDALMLKNGIGMVYRHEAYKTNYAEYTDLVGPELEEVLQGDEDTEVEVLEHEERQVFISEMSEGSQQQARMLPEVQQQVQQIMVAAQQNAVQALEESGYDITVMTPESQQLMQQFMQESAAEALEGVSVTLHSVKLRLYIDESVSKVITIPPEEFNINDDHPSIDMTNARFSCHERDYTESELIEMGIDPDIVRDLPSNSQMVDEEDFARQYHTLNRESGSTLDNTTRSIRVRNCYIRVDFDGDGIAELRHVMVAGEQVLENYYCDEVPFVCISPFMVPHRWVGISVMDRMKQIQDIATATWRQLLDNMYKMNNARTIVVENQVNMDDLLSSRAGGVVRAKSTDAIAPFPHQPIGVEAYQLLQQLSKTRMERSGVGPEMMAEGMVIDNDTAHGTERLMAAKEKLLGIIIRNFAETGVAEAFKKLHNLEIKHQDKERQVRVNGKWTDVQPWEWKQRNRTTIKVGLGAGDKQKHAMALDTVIAQQQGLLQAGQGGILVSNQNIFQAMTDRARYSGLQAPDAYFTDPDSPESKAAAEQKQKEAQEPTLEDKVIMLTSQIESKDAQLKEMKQGMTAIKDSDEQSRKWTKDKDESAREWTKLEIEADKDLGPEGRAE